MQHRKDTSADEITYIRDLLFELGAMAMARGDFILAHLIAVAWLHAWEVACKLGTADQGSEHV